MENLALYININKQIDRLTKTHVWAHYLIAPTLKRSNSFDKLCLHFCIRPTPTNGNSQYFTTLSKTMDSNKLSSIDTWILAIKLGNGFFKFRITNSWIFYLKD